MDQPVTSAEFAHTHVTFDDGLVLECGTTLRRHTVAFRTYGRLNAARSNAILICHALTLDQYVAEAHPSPASRAGGTPLLVPACPVDTRSLLCHLPERIGRLYGKHRPAEQA